MACAHFARGRGRGVLRRGEHALPKVPVGFGHHAAADSVELASTSRAAMPGASRPASPILTSSMRHRAEAVLGAAQQKLLRNGIVFHFVLRDRAVMITIHP